MQHVYETCSFSQWNLSYKLWCRQWRQTWYHGRYPYFIAMYQFSNIMQCPVQWPLPCHNWGTRYRCTWRRLGDLDNFADAIGGVSPTNSFVVSSPPLGLCNCQLENRRTWAAHREIIAFVASPSISKLGNHTHKCNTVQWNLLLLISWFDVMRYCVQIITFCEISLSKTSRVRRKITCYP